MAAGQYKMQTMARMTGFSPELLRAWERRHRLLAPVRTAGGHRLYTADDLAVLQRIREELAAGRTIGELAARGRRALLARALETSAAPSPAALVRPAAPADTGNLARWREEIVHGAVALDAEEIDRALDEASAALSPEAVAHELVEPAAHEIGRLWQTGVCSVAGEHLASAVFERRLLKQLELAQRLAGAGPAAVVACVEGEHHRLGAIVVANDLARAGRRVRYFGAALPASELVRAAQALSSPSVWVSATLPRLLKAHRADLAAAARQLGPEVAFHLGGQAVPRVEPMLEAAGVRLHPGGAQAGAGVPGREPVLRS